MLTSSVGWNAREEREVVSMFSEHLCVLVQCASKEQYEKSLQVHLTVSFGICVELLHKPNEVHSMNIKL